ncbi:lysine--tRNA ligase [Oceanirhabdus sp. W0125-5]|uniref:lysine--tRNA ligase n=1 Tax=Oceanirhabdus sp. W0125-5 TaxID=2999116 RepID=UPI0022F2F6BE|nr:lysine--tRNA ligase [Oceanirhabdus sp. W0125-5]WBW97830.1 lysine--tRNA ligase [Oceanirhabdus sp. W0125-5]
MHWAQRIAEDLISKYPEKEVFVCASGISPSGSVHIGNFREIITTYFVVRALQKLGKKTRFIFSWDDFDRFRKVPKNIDSSYEKYIGMPYSEIPDPYGCHGSYAEHFESEFEEALRVFGIDVEFIYQSKEYKSGRYNENILHALMERRRIYDILMSFKTQEPTEEQRNSFYPITLYCKSCRKDDTTIENFHESTGVIQYSCKCGNADSVKVLEADNIKLNWKIDWPMRWMVEDVLFEPGGRDHSSETGSYNVSKVIDKEIFNHKAPEYAAYEFIGIKGTNGKMSSSAGNIITPGELLKIYIPEIILFMFSKYTPNAAFNIGLDDDVLRNYSEFERYTNANELGRLNDEDIKYSLELSYIGEENRNLPKFGQMAGIFPLVNFDINALVDVMSKSGEVFSMDKIKILSDRIYNWINEWNKEKAISIRVEKDNEYYDSLSEIEKEWLVGVCNVIEDSENQDSQLLMKALYDVCHDEDKKIKKANQKRLFSIVYKLVLNSDSGPRLPLLINTVGIEECLRLLRF